MNNTEIKKALAFVDAGFLLHPRSYREHLTRYIVLLDALEKIAKGECDGSPEDQALSALDAVGSTYAKTIHNQINSRLR